MPTKQPKRILVAPMDWGLGHTTRCVPIIGYILSQGHVPVFAGNEKQRLFIEETFRGIEKIHLDGYNISFPGPVFQFVMQIPNILQTVKNEHHWLLQNAEKLGLDAIISDNRYGLYHPTLPCVIMTHQLQVQTGMGMFCNKTLQQLHYKFLNRFKEVWVVDNELPNNLAGKLSATNYHPKNTKYIGLLSQFSELAQVQNTGKNYELLVLLSGPEPQRTIFSNLLWQQLLGYKGQVAFVEGCNTDTRKKTGIPNHIQYHNILTHNELLPMLQNAEMVICRSGYSTIMDLTALGKKAILVPTPGQTEQLYLAKHLHKQDIFYSTTQVGFDLGKTLKDVEGFEFKKTFKVGSFEKYKSVLGDWLISLP